MEPAKRSAPAPARAADTPASSSNTHETTPRNIDGRVWSLRPSESLGTLRQVPVLFAALDFLDGRALARLEMTSIALERSARAAAARRARMLNYPPAGGLKLWPSNRLTGTRRRSARGTLERRR